MNKFHVVKYKLYLLATSFFCERDVGDFVFGDINILKNHFTLLYLYSSPWRHSWLFDSRESCSAAMDSLNQMTQPAIHQLDKRVERYVAKWPIKWSYVKGKRNRWNICKHTKQLVVERQVQRTCRIERLPNHIFSVYFHLLCHSTGKLQVDVYMLFNGRMQLKSRAGGYFFNARNSSIVCELERSFPSIHILDDFSFSIFLRSAYHYLTRVGRSCLL